MAQERDEELQSDYGPDVLTLLDDDGNEHEFEWLDELETENGERFVALLPIYDNPQDELDADGELVVLQVSDEGGEDFLVPIKDEETFNKISKIFMERLEDEYEFEEEPNEEI